MAPGGIRHANNRPCASPPALVARRRPRRRADEPCQSPYLQKLVGQEDFVYVWTLGVDGLGDGSDKLVTIGANPTRAGLREGGRLASPSAAATRRTTPASPTTAASSGRAASTRARSSSSTSPAIPPQPKLAEDDRRLRGEERRRGRAAHLLSDPRTHADHRALEREGRRRQDGAGRVRQRRQLRAHDLDARGRRVRLRRAREPAPEPHAHLLLHGQAATTCGRSASCCRTPRR